MPNQPRPPLNRRPGGSNAAPQRPPQGQRLPQRPPQDQRPRPPRDDDGGGGLGARYIPGPPRPGRFVYGGDQTAEQAQASRSEGRYETIFLPGIVPYRGKEGQQNRIRILPGDWEDNRNNDWSYKVYVHKNVGAENGSYLCLAKHHNEACPICEAALQSRNDGDDQEYDKLRYKTDHIMWVLDRKDRSSAGLNPKVWAVSWFFLKDVFDITTDEDSGKEKVVANLKDGHDLMFMVQAVTTDDGRTIKRPSAFQFAQQASPAAPSQQQRDALEEFIHQNPLPGLLAFKTYDELYGRLYGSVALRDRDLDTTHGDGYGEENEETAASNDPGYYDASQSDEQGQPEQGQPYGDPEPEEPGSDDTEAQTYSEDGEAGGGADDWPEQADPAPPPPRQQPRRQPQQQVASRQQQQPRRTPPPPRGQRPNPQPPRRR